jgi:hypothetical protein
MTQTFYFRKLGGWPFEMEATINDERHRANFLAAMKRKGFTQVEETEYAKDSRLRSMYASMFHK